jgi:mono/diheme cytochrome c family protein
MSSALARRLDSRFRGNDDKVNIPAKFSSVIPAKAGIQLLLALAFLSQSAAAQTDPQTGLVVAPGYEQVRAQCTACHSGRLVAQNRADRDGWLQMIRWMQATQNLWPLGEAEAEILDYLATHYGPLPRGRRSPLKVTFD